MRRRPLFLWILPVLLAGCSPDGGDGAGRAHVSKPTASSTSATAADRGLKPKALMEALSAKKPVVILVYADWDPVSRRVRMDLSAIERDYRREVTFLFLDADNQSHAALLRFLDLGYLPETVIMESSGDIYRRYRGFVDRQSMEQSIIDVLP